MGTISQLRSYRVYDIAMFDMVASMVGLAIILVVCQKKYFRNLDKNRFIVAGIVLAIPLGVFFHILFGVNTQLNYKLGLSNAPVN